METKTAPTTFYFASILNRFLATFIDGLIVSVICGVLHIANGSGLLYIIYSIFMLSQYEGQTLGKRLMNIRVVQQDGSTPDVRTATIRSFSTILSGLVLCIGYFWAFFNPKKQTWHDILANTYVVEAHQAA